MTVGDKEHDKYGAGGKVVEVREWIIADNEVRKEWNMSVDQALIALVDREDILDVKEKNILGEIRRSIVENGIAPGLFSAIVGKAVTLVKEMMHRAYDRGEAAANDTPISVTEVETKTLKSGKIPPKPKKPSGIEEFEYYQSIFNKIKRYGGKIRANEKTIDVLETAVKSCTSVFQMVEKFQYEKEIGIGIVKYLTANKENVSKKQEHTKHEKYVFICNPPL